MLVCLCDRSRMPDIVFLSHKEGCPSILMKHKFGAPGRIVNFFSRVFGVLNHILSFLIESPLTPENCHPLYYHIPLDKHHARVDTLSRSPEINPHPPNETGC